MSSEMTESWESEAVQEEATDVVALQISSSSEDCKHFSQICILTLHCRSGITLIGGATKPCYKQSALYYYNVQLIDNGTFFRFNCMHVRVFFRLR